MSASAILPLFTQDWAVSISHVILISLNAVASCTEVENAHVDLKHRYCKRELVLLCYEVLARRHFLMTLGESSVGHLK